MAVKHGIKESLIEAELVARVKALGGLCEKVQAIGCRGFFDRLVILPGGRILFVEVKRPRGGKMSAHQWQRNYQYEKLGCAVAIISSSEDIDALLND